jgi:hypothetical protein
MNSPRLHKSEREEPSSVSIPMGWHGILILIVILLMLVQMGLTAWSELMTEGFSGEMLLLPAVALPWSWAAGCTWTAAVKARKLGAAIQFDSRGVQVPGEPLLPWRFVRTFTWARDSERVVSLSMRIVIGPDFVAWRDRKRAFDFSSPRLKADVVEVPSLMWEARGNGYGERVLQFVQRVAPHVEIAGVGGFEWTFRHHPEQPASIPSGYGTNSHDPKRDREIDEAREAAMALIYAGARAADPALKEAWKRYDTLREIKPAEADRLSA